MWPEPQGGTRRQHACALRPSAAAASARHAIDALGMQRSSCIAFPLHLQADGVQKKDGRNLPGGGGGGGRKGGALGSKGGGTGATVGGTCIAFVASLICFGAGFGGVTSFWMCPFMTCNACSRVRHLQLTYLRYLLELAHWRAASRACAIAYNTCERSCSMGYASKIWHSTSKCVACDLLCCVVQALTSCMYGSPTASSSALMRIKPVHMRRRHEVAIRTGFRMLMGDAGL